MNKELIIVRHGKTDLNVLGQAVGSTNVALNERGLQEVDELCGYLTQIGIKPEVILASPYTRAYDTAVRLQEVVGGTLETSEFLREIHYGTYEGAGREVLQEIAYGYNTAAMIAAGAETSSQVETRVRQLLQHIAQRPESCFVLVTHAFTASVFQQMLLGMPLDVAHIQPLATADFTYAFVAKGGENGLKLIAMQRNVLKGPLPL